MKSAIPETIGKYQIVSKLGQGGMGVVYQAIQKPLDRPVALKILPAEFAINEEYLARFMREAKTVATLRHENVVQVYDAGEHEGQYYIAMELVDGANLLKYAESKQRIEEREGLDLLLQAAKGLAAAHAKGLVHRDIKPENMLIGTDKILRILDFGLVMESASTTQLTATGACLGTPMYMSPEQADGLLADARTDLYSLGVSFYRVFTGETPFSSPTVMNLLFKHKFEPPRDPRSIRPDLSDNVANLLTHLLAKNRDDRPKSAQALVEMLEGLKQGKRIPPPVLTPAPGVLASGMLSHPHLQSTSAASAHKALLLTAVLMAAILAMGLWFMLGTGRGDAAALKPEPPAPREVPPAAKENWVLNGDEAYAIGRYSDALESYKKASLETPDNPGLKSKIDRTEKAQKFEETMQAGYALESKGEFDAATTKYREAADLDPGTKALEQIERVKAGIPRGKEVKVTATDVKDTAGAVVENLPPDTATPNNEHVQIKAAVPPSERDQLARKAEAARKAGEFELAAQYYSGAAAKSDGALRNTFADQANDCRRQDYVKKAFRAEEQKRYAEALELYKKAQALKADTVVNEKVAALQAKIPDTAVKIPVVPVVPVAPVEPAAVPQIVYQFGGRKKIEDLVQALKDNEALAAIITELASDPKNTEIRNCKTALEGLQACATIYGESEKIFDAAQSRLSDALDLDDDDKTQQSKSGLRTLRTKFAENAKAPRPAFLAQNYDAVAAAMKGARDDAGELSAQLASAAEMIDRKAGRISDKAVKAFGLSIGGDKKKADKFSGIAESLRKFAEQAKALRN